MDESLLKEVKQSFQDKKSIELIEMELIEKGYLESDISEAISMFTQSLQKGRHAEKRKISKQFFFKEIYDRIGYGFGSQQFVNILFFHSGASLFMLGIVNSIKAIIGSLFSSYLREYTKENVVNSRVVGYFGILFGFSFIVMAAARHLGLVWLFALAMIVGTLGVVSYGEFYKKLLFDIQKGEKRGPLREIYTYGLMITGASLLVAAFILDRIPNIRILSINLSGYMIVFEIAAICFIISGYILTLIQTKVVKTDSVKRGIQFANQFFSRITKDANEIFKIKVMWVLLITATISGVVQIIGHSFYGIFIYQSFKYVGFGGFINVAIISFIAIVTSLLTPLITKQNVKEYGKFPMLVFGTMLMAITPLTFSFNPNLVSITIGILLGVMGSAIVGIAQGFLAMELLPLRLRESYFNINSIFVTLPYLILVPAGSYFGQIQGLRKLFLSLGVMLLVVVMPMYLFVIIFEEVKSRKK